MKDWTKAIMFTGEEAEFIFLALGDAAEVWQEQAIDEPDPMQSAAIYQMCSRAKRLMDYIAASLEWEKTP